MSGEVRLGRSEKCCSLKCVFKVGGLFFFWLFWRNRLIHIEWVSFSFLQCSAYLRLFLSMFIHISVLSLHFLFALSRKLFLTKNFYVHFIFHLLFERGKFFLHLCFTLLLVFLIYIIWYIHILTHNWTHIQYRTNTPILTHNHTHKNKLKQYHRSDTVIKY